jgi:drug/metabolite transporter (DMT)-like permease
MAWALAVVMFQRSGESMAPFALNLLKNALSLGLMVLTLLAVTVYAREPLPGFSAMDLGIMLLSGVLGMAVADTLYLRTLNLIGAGRTGAIGALLSPCVILFSALYLGERLGLAQWAGFALVMAGILVVTLKRYRTEVSTTELRRGLLIGVAAMVTMALGVVMVKPQLEQGPFLWVVTIRLAGGVAAMLLLTAWRRQWRTLWNSYRKPHPWAMTLFACVLGGYLGSLFWLAGYKLIPASEAAVYNESQLIFMVLFAWWFLKEPIDRRRTLGVGFILVGVLVMLLV